MLFKRGSIFFKPSPVILLIFTVILSAVPGTASADSSGVKLSAETVSEFDEFQRKKEIKYLIYAFNSDNTKIITESRPVKLTSEFDASNAHYDEFVRLLPEKEVRYGIIDISHNISEGQRSQTIFIAWIPDEAPIKQKMLAASSKDAFKALPGIRTRISAKSRADLDKDTIIATLFP